MRSFVGRVCVVTGAGSGIGRALSLALASRGARLALSDIDFAAVEETAKRCRQAGAEAEPHALDVSRPQDVLAHAGAVMERFGAVNLVVNNAGVALAKDVLNCPIEDYEWIMGINFWGVVYSSKAFLPHLIASGEGHLVNVSSVFGLFAVPGQSGYNASKFAVRGFTEALAQEMRLAGHPVGVSCVHPGGVRTAIARSARTDRQATPGELDEAFQRIAHTSPERAAATILRGIERNRARILVGADAHLLDAMTRVLGPAYQRVVSAASRRLDPSA